MGWESTLTYRVMWEGGGDGIGYFNSGDGNLHRVIGGRGHIYGPDRELPIGWEPIRYPHALLRRAFGLGEGY
jgi:hypothetical protein